MTLTLQPIRVATGFDEEGVLVLDEERRLVAVLVHLSEENEVAPGQWYLETKFGLLEGLNQLTYADLDEARNEIARCLDGRGRSRNGSVTGRARG